MTKHNQDQEVCSVCQAEPQDMLILSCRHNLCLDCATEVYNLNSKQDKIVCQICLTDTQLDSDTIVCLRSLSAKHIIQSKKQPLSYIGLSKQQNRQQLFPPKSTKKGLNNYNQSPMITEEEPLSQQLRCLKHNEELTYFCMDCGNFRICSECMLQQNHRFHKVITLKKATVQIKQTIEKVIRQKEVLRNMLSKDKENLVIRKEQSQKQLMTNLSELKVVFEEMNKVIIAKYNQVCQMLQEDGNRKLEIMQGAINQIEQKITLIQDTIQFQQELIQQAVMKNTQQFQNKRINSGNTVKESAMRMFEYYEKQITENRVDFEPSLPNFISQVTQLKIYQKQHVFEQLQNLLNEFRLIPNQNQISEEQQSQDEEINYISQIQDQRELIQKRDKQSRQQKYEKQRQNNFNHNVKKYEQNHHEHQNYRPVSQNINIIQLNPNLNNKSTSIKKGSNMNIINAGKNNVSIKQQKLSKESIEEIKRKARQNIKDRQLSNSRKMQLSRSIQNANEILNKIQSRSVKI